jgi:peptide chain release factor 2
MRRSNYGGRFDIDRKVDRRKSLEQDSVKDGFWDDSRKAQTVMRELEGIKSQIKQVQDLQTMADDVGVLFEFYQEDSSKENETEVTEAIAKADALIEDMHVTKMLSGQLDPNGAYILINAGAGGTESCDWASMLLRMFLRYAEAKGYKASLIDSTDGDGAGYRSATVQVDGEFAYGYLKAESGVHRLVRISPFDSNNRRHTSFCSVFVYAQVNDDIDIQINEDDIEMEAMRASGAGGQKVNKTSSAIRLTHKPSGIVVKCQTERSQHQNRATAMSMLKSRLYEKELEKQNSEKQKVEDTKKDNAWGSQIRSYVLHPYQMIKDHRTGLETSQTQKVLDGELDALIKEYLIRGDSAAEEVID